MLAACLLWAGLDKAVEHPIAQVSESFIDPMRWCDMLILPLNTKHCRASSGNNPSVIMVSIGRKSYEELDKAHPVDFSYGVKASSQDYFDIRLFSRKGPLGTSDYSIMLEAVEMPGGKTFLHLTYSYSYGFVARVAMQGYLATLGRSKVGFTRIDRHISNPPEYIGGVRAAVERNTMRYYLAIDAYLDALSAPAPERFDRRLQSWFSATELYARQLHEVDRAAYLDMKRAEYQRMRSPP
ncbi:MAG: hypothetical protein ACOYNZ_16550 [Rhodoferax sp.]